MLGQSVLNLLCADMDADAIFGVNDNRVNGDILIIERAGDTYDDTAAYVVTLPSDFPDAADAVNFDHIVYTRAQVTAMLMINCYNINAAVPEITLAQAAELAYIRFLCVKYKLMSSRYVATNYHCDYNQCVKLAGDRTDTASILGDNANGIPRASKADVQAALLATLTADHMTKVNKSFTNLVCLVAYMFRTRAHHFLPDMAKRYAELWAKTATGKYAFVNTFEKLATVGLHAVMPFILDNFWTNKAENDKCDVILKLRVNCACAGTALIPVLDQGLRDILTVFPQVENVMQDEIKYVKDMEAHLTTHRWDHGINARFYNADTERIDEKQTGAIGALIRAAVTQLAPGTDLENSRALARAAKLAPITGAALGLALKNYVKSDKFVALQAAPSQ